MSLNLTVLRLFFRELPDPGIQLFYQDNPTTRFHRFNKLSTELRLVIWNLVRGRKIIVRVDVYCCLRSNTPVPVTFGINQESRRETIGIIDHCTSWTNIRRQSRSVRFTGMVRSRSGYGVLPRCFWFSQLLFE
jgi:hypothetical protein